MMARFLHVMERRAERCCTMARFLHALRQPERWWTMARFLHAYIHARHATSPAASRSNADA